MISDRRLGSGNDFSARSTGVPASSGLAVIRTMLDTNASVSESTYLSKDARSSLLPRDKETSAAAAFSMPMKDSLMPAV